MSSNINVLKQIVLLEEKLWLMAFSKGRVLMITTMPAIIMFGSHVSILKHETATAVRTTMLSKIKQYILQNPSPREFLQGLRDLMIDSCAKFTRDVRQNVVTPPDRSRLSVPLQVALQKLNDDDIDEIEFLEIMASS